MLETRVGHGQRVFTSKRFRRRVKDDTCGKLVKKRATPGRIAADKLDVGKRKAVKFADASADYLEHLRMKASASGKAREMVPDVEGLGRQTLSRSGADGRLLERVQALKAIRDWARGLDQKRGTYIGQPFRKSWAGRLPLRCQAEPRSAAARSRPAAWRFAKEESRQRLPFGRFEAWAEQRQIKSLTRSVRHALHVEQACVRRAIALDVGRCQSPDALESLYEPLKPGTTSSFQCRRVIAPRSPKLARCALKE